MATVIERGLFVLDERRRFDLRTYAASVKELRDHWALVGAYDPEEPEETLMRRRDEMYARAHGALERTPAPRSSTSSPRRCLVWCRKRA